jgi:hypothetical protein
MNCSIKLLDLTSLVYHAHARTFAQQHVTGSGASYKPAFDLPKLLKSSETFPRGFNLLQYGEIFGIILINIQKEIDMVKRMEEVEVDVNQDGYIELRQPNPDHPQTIITLSPYQIDMVIEWLKEAKEEALKQGE